MREIPLDTGTFWRLEGARGLPLQASMPSVSLGRRAAAVAALWVLATPLPALAQAPPPDPTPPAVTMPREIELNLINLPTTMSVKRHHSYFRLTHRFARDLRRGDFGDLAADFFSLDNGAIIGLEYRFAITERLHAGVHRSLLSKTLLTFARYDAVSQGDVLPISVSLTGGVEGLNNLRQQYQPSIAATLSHTLGGTLAIYATPAYVGRTHVADFLTGHDHGIGGAADDEGGHAGTFFVGFGGRLRVRPAVYVVGEYSPRVSGYTPNKSTWGAAIERRTRGHMFQMNFTNSFGTTLGQIARGGNPHDVYLGFNITRKF